MRHRWQTIHLGLNEKDEAGLPEGDVTVRLSHSNLNYKDALAITGKAPVVRTSPMVPGIDLAGNNDGNAEPSGAANPA